MVCPESEKDSSGLRTIEDQWKRAQEIDDDIRELSLEVETRESDLKEMVAVENDVDLAEAVSGERVAVVADHIRSVEKRKASIAEQVDGFDDWLDGTRAEFSKLREEARYQQLQRDLSDLRAINADMERVKRAFEANGGIWRVG